MYILSFKISNNIKIYYIDSTINSITIVLKLLDKLLRSKYFKITFYYYNLEGFNIFYILKVLTIFNKGVKSKNNEYKLN